jgi:hypothetical protein
MLAALGATAVEAADPGRFDGSWAVTLACPGSPDGAVPFTFRFVANVKDGVLHGENGQAGQPGWMSLDGPIQPDGAAVLDANGIAGHAAYNINATQAGTPYHHSVTAHFDAARGTGQWVTVRACDFTFVRP